MSTDKKTTQNPDLVDQLVQAGHISSDLAPVLRAHLLGHHLADGGMPTADGDVITAEDEKTAQPADQVTLKAPASIAKPTTEPVSEADQAATGASEEIPSPDLAKEIVQQSIDNPKFKSKQELASEDFQKQLELQKQLNPGQPEAMIREEALTALEQQRGAEGRQAASELQAAKDAQARAIEENKRRADIGLPPLPVPELPTSAPATAPTQPSTADHAAAVEDAAKKAIVTHDTIQKVAAQKQVHDADNAQLLQQQAAANTERHVQTYQDIMDSGPLGQKIGASLALLLGGVSQGALGLKENPILGQIQQQINNEVERRKLTGAEQAAAREALFKQAELKLRAMAERSNIGLQSIQAQMGIAQLQQMQQQAQLDQVKRLAIMGGGALPSYLLNPEEQKSAVADPENPLMRRIAANPAAAAALQTERKDLEPVIGSLSSIFKQVNDPNFSKLDPQQKLVVEGQLQQLVYQAKKALTGSGRVAEQDKKDLMTAIGDPAKIFSWGPIERAKMASAIAKYKNELNQSWARAGIVLPGSNESAVVKRFQDKGK